ncbi:MAG: pyridoxal phosphate-dependent decarboxylase family protein, partial [Chitinophagales bacterium]
GSAFIIPAQQHYLKGIDSADSYVFNPHKWLMTNFDCSCFYIKDTKHLVNTYTHTPDYINARPAEQVNNYKDWGLPLGRRFRALKLWFVMRSFGLKGLQHIIQRHLDIAQHFYEKISNTAHWEIMAPFAMNVICLRYHPEHIQDAEQLNKLNEEILHAINKEGSFYLTGTRLNNNYIIRVVPGQQYVTTKHTDKLFTLLEETAKKISAQNGW